MTVSIIIPTLDEVDNLRALLPALVVGCPEAEIVVADGGSRDGTAGVARGFGVRVVSSAPGRAHQMNEGARHAGGTTLMFLHADTRLPSGAPTAVDRALMDPRVVGGRFDVALDNPRPIFGLIARLINLRSRWSRICTGDQTIFVRRTVFEALGGYAEIPLMEDVDFARRLKRAGRLVCLRDRVTTSARKWEREGVVRTVVLMWALRLLYFVGVPPAWLHRVYYGRWPG